MSRKHFSRPTIYFALALTAACCLLALTACNKSGDDSSLGPTCYDISFRYDSDSRTLTATEEALYTAPSDLDELVLHVYANAFENARIDILSVQIDRTTADFEIYGSDSSLMRVPVKLYAGDACCLRIEYKVLVPISDTRLGVTSAGTVNLSCFYPVLAHFDGGWREDEYVEMGDPFMSDIASYFVRAEVDEKLSVACSGVKEERVENGVRYVEIEAENVRDLAIVLGEMDVRSSSVAIESGSVDVSLYYPACAPAIDMTEEKASAMLEVACDSVRAFSEAFGDYPYPTYTLAISALSGAGGMEYGGMAIICPSESADDVIIHETAHQWWYGAVGNDQLNDAWLDEGLSEYCTAYYYFLIGDRARYASHLRALSASYADYAQLRATVGFDGRMSRHLTTYLTDGEYAAVAYVKGALLFDCLHTLVGDGKFRAAMKRYYADNKFSIADSSSLAAAFDAQGYDIRPLLRDWLTGRL